MSITTVQANAYLAFLESIGFSGVQPRAQTADRDTYAFKYVPTGDEINALSKRFGNPNKANVRLGTKPATQWTWDIPSNDGALVLYPKLGIGRLMNSISKDTPLCSIKAMKEYLRQLGFGAKGVHAGAAHEKTGFKPVEALLKSSADAQGIYSALQSHGQKFLTQRGNLEPGKSNFLWSSASYLDPKLGVLTLSWDRRTSAAALLRAWNTTDTTILF